MDARLALLTAEHSVGVGALPLAPGQSSQSLDDMRERINDVLYDGYLTDEKERVSLLLRYC